MILILLISMIRKCQNNFVASKYKKKIIFNYLRQWETIGYFNSNFWRSFERFLIMPLILSSICELPKLLSSFSQSSITYLYIIFKNYNNKKNIYITLLQTILPNWYSLK